MKNLILAFVFFPLLAVCQKYDVPNAINQFGFDFYRSGSATPENLIFSPFSVSTSLAMTAAGAQQKTLEQMKKVLHLTGPYHNDFKKFLGTINEVGESKLVITDRLWGQKSAPFKPDFIKTLEDYYGADIVALDFKNHPESSREKINLWVKQKTNGKIPELLKRNSLNRKTELVLTNSIYVKANWLTKFEKSKTAPQFFQMSSTKKVKTLFMNMTDEFRYNEDVDWQYLSIPYRGDQFSLDIFLPRKSILLSTLDRKIDSKFFKLLSKNARPYKVVVSLPKFRFESSFELNSWLSKIGMPLAFDEYFGNFRGIKDLSPNEKFYISKFIHKALINFDEDGSEASATPAVVADFATDAATDIEPSLPKIFNADRPFLFFVRHSYSGVILLMGRFSKP